MAKSKEKLSLLERSQLIALGKGVQFGADDDPLATAFPTLWEWLSRTEMGDDFIKSPARVTIQLTPGGVAVAFMDSGIPCSMDVACVHAHEWAEALDKAFQLPNPPMRFWDGKEPKVRKRRKSP